MLFVCHSALRLQKSAAVASETWKMTSISSFGGLSLLDLPPEIRVRIYEFAIPEEIPLQTWDYNAEIKDRIYTIQLAEQDQPKFIFANRLIHREASQVFWDRVTLDHSYLSENGRAVITSLDDGSEDAQISNIKVSEQNAEHVQKLVISTQADGITERIWPCSFPNLKSISITYLPADISDRDLQRIFFRARAAKRSKNLISIVGEYFVELLGSPSFNTDIAINLSSILAENKYSVSVSLLPIKVYQTWSIDLWSGMIHEFRHDATALLKFDCNADDMTCRFTDVNTGMIKFQDTLLPCTVGPTRDSDKDQVRQMYRVTEEVVRVKNMDLLERLICREIEDREMIPKLSAARRVAGHI